MSIVKRFKKIFTVTLSVAWRIESGMNCEFISVMRPA